MGLVGKLKNILFEEEEVEIPIIEKKEKKRVEEPVYKEMPRKEVAKPAPQPVYQNNYSSFYDEEASYAPPVKEQVKPQGMREMTPSQPRESSQPRPMEQPQSYAPKNDFKFPFDFDDDEFADSLPRRSTNVMEYEKKQRVERVEKTEPKEKVTDYKRVEKKEEVKTKFKPSPIISPVYGILDKNYTPDEIKTRDTNLNARNLDVDSVRKKAFGTLEEKEEERKQVPKQEEIIDRKKLEEEQILEERLEKARTIDELLKDSSDDIIELDTKEEVESKMNMASIEEEEDTIDSLEDIEPTHEENSDEDTLENDLFDLIDSMYENREDGE